MIPSNSRSHTLWTFQEMRNTEKSMKNLFTQTQLSNCESGQRCRHKHQPLTLPGGNIAEDASPLVHHAINCDTLRGEYRLLIGNESSMVEDTDMTPQQLGKP